MSLYTPGTGVTGIVGSDALTTRDLLVDSFSANLIALNPNGSAPLFALTDAIKETKTAKQRLHSFWTQKLVFPSMKLDGTALGAGTAGTEQTVTVVSTTSIIPGMIVSNYQTNEQLLVTEVVSATQVKLIRGFGSTAPAAGGTTDDLIQVGNAFEEASVRPTAMAMAETEVTNNTQIFRNTWAVPGTIAASALKVGGSKVSRDKKECSWFHAMDIEKSLWFSEKYSGTRNGQPIRAMRGLVPAIREFASGNITAAGATTTYDQLEAAIDPVFNTVTDPSFSQMRVGFCGGTARKVINSIGRKTGQIQLTTDETAFGMQFERFKLSRGEIMLVEHPLFNAYTPYNNMLAVVDLGSIDLAYLEGRKTKHNAFNQNVNSEGVAVDNGIDAEGGTLTSELTLEVTNPAANAVITGLTAAA